MLALAIVLCGQLVGQCTLTFTPASGRLTAAGGDGTFVVNASTANCARSAVSNNPDWLTVSFGQIGNGSSGTVGYTAKANTLGQARTGTIALNGQQFAVSQDAAVCTYSLTPSGSAVPVIVTAGAGQTQMAVTLAIQ